MKILVGYNCLQCFVEQIDKVLSLTNFSDEKKRGIFLNGLNFLYEIAEWNCSPPEIARQLYDFLYKELNNSNPFEKIKEETNATAKEALLLIKRQYTNLTLEDYAKFAVAGNIIDFGVKGRENNFAALKIVETLKSIKFDINHFYKFQNQLKDAKSILYILDNSGEAIFDKAFMEQIKKHFPYINIVIAARNKNIINDISFDDAIKLNFSSIGDVISTGYNGPGVVIDKTSKEFLESYKKADIIIAKGQGNFETLWGENQNIFFGLKIKCNHVANISGFKLNANLFINGLNF